MMSRPLISQQSDDGLRKEMEARRITPVAVITFAALELLPGRRRFDEYVIALAAFIRHAQRLERYDYSASFMSCSICSPGLLAASKFSSTLQLFMH